MYKIKLRYPLIFFLGFYIAVFITPRKEIIRDLPIYQTKLIYIESIQLVPYTEPIGFKPIKPSLVYIPDITKYPEPRKK